MSTHFAFVDIVLDGNKKRFQSGEDVTGVIRFSLKGSSIVEKIKISLISVSEVEWSEISRIIRHFDSYISDEVLSKGEHEVPFSFKLPEKYVLLIDVLRVKSFLKFISKEVYPLRLWDMRGTSNTTSK